VRAAATHPVDEELPTGQLFVYGAQHVLAMYAGAIAVPLLVGSALHLTPEQLIYLINADLFTSGIASFVQAFGLGPLGVRLPLIQGVTFAAVAPMILIGQQYGIPAIYGAVIVAGLATMLLSGAFSRLLRFFPPLVMGTIITTIGVSLMPVAVLWAGGGNPAAATFGSLPGIALAVFTLAVVLGLASFARGFVRNTAVLLGIVAGTAVAALFGMADFGEVGSAGWLGVTTPFHFGLPSFQLVPCLVMVLVMLVTMTETTGDILAVGEMVGRPATPADLKRGLMADGFCTVLGGVLNSFPYTAFAENVGLVGLSRVKSRFVVAAAGLILMTLGLFPKAAAIVASIPTPVIGGAGLVMFGMVAATGIRILQKTRFEGTNGALVLGVSVGLGLIPVTMPAFYQQVAPGLRIFLDSGIAVGAVAAILLNLGLNWRHRAAEDGAELHAAVAAE
jgi:NCS2 family nucleobase:cation symporter-2